MWAVPGIPNQAPLHGKSHKHVHTIQEGAGAPSSPLGLPEPSLRSSDYLGKLMRDKSSPLGSGRCSGYIWEAREGQRSCYPIRIHHISPRDTRLLSFIQLIILSSLSPVPGVIRHRDTVIKFHISASPQPHPSPLAIPAQSPDSCTLPMCLILTPMLRSPCSASRFKVGS